MTGTPIDHLNIVKGQQIRCVFPPNASWVALEYVATKDQDHRGLDCTHFVMTEDRNPNYVETVNAREVATAAGDHVVAVFTVDGMEPSSGFVLSNTEALRLGTILIGLARQSEIQAPEVFG